MAKKRLRVIGTGHNVSVPLRDGLEKRLAGPDRGREGADGVEAEFVVELDGGAIFCGDGEGEFLIFHLAEGFGGGLHEDATESVALIAGLNADLRGVGNSGRDFTSEDGSDEVFTSRLVQDEGSAGNELSATG